VNGSFAVRTDYPTAAHETSRDRQELYELHTYRTRREFAVPRTSWMTWFSYGFVDLGPWHPLYLFCTWTSGFSRISPMERFSLFRLFEKSKDRADRLPPPPPTFAPVPSKVARR